MLSLQSAFILSPDGPSNLEFQGAQASRTPGKALLLALLVLTHAAPAASGAYLGWIPQQEVRAGSEWSLDLRRFYEPAPGTQLEIPASGTGYEAAFNEKTLRLTVRVKPDAQGILEIPLRTSGGSPREALLALAVRPKAGHTFRYEAKSGTPSKVTVAGAFNGWNTDSHPMEAKGQGRFELFVPLEAGGHPYKFLVDGKWITDPENPQTTPDGNSFIEVGGSTGGAPRVFAEAATPDALTFRWFTSGGDISKVSAIVQRPDGSSALLEAKPAGGLVRIPTKGLPDGSWVRLAVADAQGRVSAPARAQVRPTSTFQWQDAIIYYAFTDRFVNGDTSNDRPVKDDRVLPQANYQGGDFQGIQQKIEQDYFKKLGVNVLWLAPLNRNPEGAWQEYLPPYRFYTGYHGYWPVSSTEVEPRFGGEKGLTNLVQSAHKNDVRIIADLVLKHTHVEHPFWKEKRDWYGSVDLPGGKKNLRIWDEHQFTTWFEEWLPAFNFEKEEPVRFLIDNAIDWARRFNLDGYRLDAVKHIHYSFWWKFRAALRDSLEAGRKEPMYFVGETFMDRAGIMSFVGPNMLDSQFDFPLYDTLMEVFATERADFGELEKSLTASETVYGKETVMSPLVGNHDKSRFMAFADGDLPESQFNDEEELGWNKPPKVDDPANYGKLKMALTFILAIDGAPMIYYGDEVGMTGAGDPDNRRMLPLDKDLEDDQLAVREHFSRAAAARRNHPALRYGSRRAVLVESARYAFTRRHFEDGALVVWNRGRESSDYELEVGPDLPDGSYKDAFSKLTIEVKSGRASFTLPGRRSALFVKP